MDPKEGDVICDPASGSGGFLIRFFEIVREQILADADRQYQAYKAEMEGKKLHRSQDGPNCCAHKYDELQETIDQTARLPPVEAGQPAASTAPTPTTAWPAPAR